MIAKFRSAVPKLCIGTIAVFFSGGLVLAQAPAPKSGPIVDDTIYTSAQRLVEIEPGRRLNIYCTGIGSPTVVFDSGLTDENSVWGKIQPVVAKRTKTCTYDRAGVGFSDAARRAGSSENIVDDLHRLLIAAGIKPPYVLVGHSYGGMNVKLFAYRYPDQVSGMVLVDPSHENQGIKLRKIHTDFDQTILSPRLKLLHECISGARSGFKPGSELYANCVNPTDPHFSTAINEAHLALYLKPAFQQAQLGEEESLMGHVSGDQVRAARHTLGNIPLIVLTRSPNKSPLSPEETQQQRDAINQGWIDLHDDIASLSSRGVNRIVPDTGHYIQFDQPQVVNGAIAEVLATLRSN